MRIEIRDGKPEKKKLLLKPEAILRYLISADEDMENLIFFRSSDVDIITTDRNVYEALGSVKPYDEFKLNKLAKLFEVVEVQPQEKVILKDERVEEIRKNALKKMEQEQKNPKQKEEE